MKRKKELFCLAVVIGIVILMNGCNKQNFFNAEMKQYMKIKTEYATLQFPQEYKDNLKQQELTEDSKTIEVFSMVAGEAEEELFRIVFGQSDAENPIGYIHTDSGAKSIVLEISDGDGIGFYDEETIELYHNMIDSLNVVVESIRANENFSEYKSVSENKDNETKMTYWKVSLPESMNWEESTEGNIYQADFYGLIENKKIKLYTIIIGGEDSEDSIGKFKINGNPEPIFIEINDIESNKDLSEEDILAAFSLMDTVNDVITSMTESDNYYREE